MPKKALQAAQVSDTESVESIEALPTGDHLALRLWLRLLGCHNLMEGQLRTKLREDFDTTLPRFDLMSQLYRYPEGLRMRAVSQLLMVTGGNVTGLTDNLVKEGLVERREDPTDRRAYFIALTPEGRTQFAKMAVAHEQWVMSLLSFLDESEQQQLSGLLGKLKSRLADAR
ncbi:MarR family winged helix-turn-helix transcriptional regulator [Azoarcus sp. KH32C]|uniref:MarR family winged helix-turn-helix transcriptional regulator n=1 Tax=Azoarcus sp. KH32C TaxID=748247 RepID=UPI00023865F2|nr:MarR family transcriptional regulator [Azoarcus sp. KH32C]BAL24177.1 transcriptional regulator, MarR family [Azoarcus sp. KH32C]